MRKDWENGSYVVLLMKCYPPSESSGMASAQQPFHGSSCSAEPLFWDAGPLCCHLAIELAKVSQSSADETDNGGEEGLSLNIKAFPTTS